MQNFKETLKKLVQITDLSDSNQPKFNDLEKELVKSYLIQLYESLKMDETGVSSMSVVSEEIKEEIKPDPPVEEKHTVIEMHQETSSLKSDEKKAATKEEETSEVEIEATKEMEQDGIDSTSENSVNDHLKKPIETLSERLAKSNTRDMSDMIDLNQRILFISKLFKNDKELYTKSLLKIDQMDSLDQATTYVMEELSEPLGWIDEKEAGNRFMELIQKKFTNTVE